MLLDPPSVTGLPPEQISGIVLPRTRGLRLIAIGAIAALTLSVLAGITIARPSGRGYAAPILMLRTPFPSSVAGGHPPRPTASPGRSHPAPSAMPRPSTMPATTAPVTPSSAMTTAPAVVSPGTTTGTTTAPPTVTYAVISQGQDGFESEITIANTGSSAISGWQIVVALPGDQVTSASANAAGYFSNHVLLLHPAGYADSVPANGTLSVFFTAYGEATTPELCAFNDTICALRCPARGRRASRPARQQK